MLTLKTSKAGTLESDLAMHFHVLTEVFGELNELNVANRSNIEALTGDEKLAAQYRWEGFNDAVHAVMLWQQEALKRLNEVSEGNK